MYVMAQERRVRGGRGAPYVTAQPIVVIFRAVQECALCGRDVSRVFAPDKCLSSAETSSMIIYVFAVYLIF